MMMRASLHFGATPLAPRHVICSGKMLSLYCNQKQSIMNAESEIQTIRTLALSSIRNFMSSRKIRKLDFTRVFVYPPKIKDDYALESIVLDSDNYTLIFNSGKKLTDEKLSLKHYEMDVESIAKIADWLDDDDTTEQLNEDLANLRLLNGEKEYTFRFSTTTWVDITVFAKDLGAATAEAQAMYDLGDYDRSDEDIEENFELISEE